MMDHGYINNSILRLCAQPRTFEFLSKKMKGLDPIKLLQSLNDLVAKGVLNKERDYWAIVDDKELTIDVSKTDQQLYFKKYMGHFDFLKTPHPLDFEWRNTVKSLNYLTDLITETNMVNDSVLIIGMPTLFANVCHRDIPQNVTLVERNPPIIEALNKLCKEKTKVYGADVFKVDPVRIGKYYSVFMDPPWYSEHFYQFIWLAARCIKLGGFLVISIPPINTRPNIGEERINWFTFCHQQGLCVENLYSHKLEYAMPFFEFNAFRTAGVTNILPFWRKGDLVIFRKVNDSEVDRPPFVESASHWEEKIIDSVRIRVNTQDDESDEEFKAESLVKLDILASVSRREPIRGKANVWTSGNRIFRVSNPKKYWDFLNNRYNSKKPSQEDMHMKEFTDQFIKLETKEYNDYLECVYYEMERENN